MSRKRENDKWIFGLDRTSLPSPLKIYPESARDLMDGEARSCVENSRRENHPKTFPTVRNRVARRSTRRDPGGSFPTPFFLFPLFSLLPSPPPRPYRPLVSSAGSAGLFIFAVSKRVTDDGTMLIIPSMWEPIVARSYRGREWQRPGFSRPRFLWYDYIGEDRFGEETASRREYIYIYTYPYGEGTELNGGTESS